MTAPLQSDQPSPLATEQTRLDGERPDPQSHQVDRSERLVATVEEARLGGGRTQSSKRDTALDAIGNWVNEGGSGGEVRR